MSNVTLYDGEGLQVEPLCNSGIANTLNCNGTNWTCNAAQNSSQQETASIISGTYNDNVLQSSCRDTRVSNYPFNPDWPCYIEPSTSTSSTPTITSTPSIESSSITTSYTPSTTSPSPATTTTVSMVTSSTSISPSTSTSIASSGGPIVYKQFTTPSSSIVSTSDTNSIPSSESTLILVSTTSVAMTISTILPTPSNAANQCSEDGIWRATPAGENATSHNACYNGSASGAVTVLNE